MAVQYFTQLFYIIHKVRESLATLMVLVKEKGGKIYKEKERQRERDYSDQSDWVWQGAPRALLESQCSQSKTCMFPGDPNMHVSWRSKLNIRSVLPFLRVHVLSPKHACFLAIQTKQMVVSARDFSHDSMYCIECIDVLKYTYFLILKVPFLNPLEISLSFHVLH